MNRLDTGALLALLPPFEAATRRRAAEVVAAHLSEGRSLREVVADTLAERDRVEEILDRLRLLQRARSLAEHPAGLTALYRELTGAPPDWRAARAIAAGRLDATALEERAWRQLRRLESQTLVAFLAGDRLEREAAQDQGVSALAERLAAESSWLLARAGLEALAARAAAGRPPGRGPLAAAQALLAAAEAPVWTQVAAMELLVAALGPASAPLLAARLRPRSDPDDRFVRAAASRALPRSDPGTAASTLADAIDGEPSEYVRMEMATQLGVLGAVDRLWASIDPARESSPRVRAVAAIALGALDPRALISVLENDPDPIPRRIALEEAETLAPRHPPLQQAIDRLASGKIDAPPALARLAAEAAERVHHQLDPSARAALAAAGLATKLREGSRCTIATSVPTAPFGRALSVLATDDFGFEARAFRRGFVVTRGDRWRRRLWRLLHEVRHPAPGKRQGHRHTVGRLRIGALRAPSGRLAEVTASRVPGEPVLAPALGDWGRHLPVVDDLLHRPRGGDAFIFSAFGVARLRFPAGWLGRTAIRARLTFGYARYAELRARALSSADPAERGGFARAVRRLGYGLDFFPHRDGAPGEVLELYRGGGPSASGGSPAGLALAVPPLAELYRAVLNPSTTGPGHLAALTVAALGLFVARHNEARRRIERARASLPLSLGGWGTRGKSGTERLKAALFQGLGCEVLAKTTGCEAMLIHALPGRRGQEIFIYRPYDKATIWEQQHLLEIAARLDVDVFLWECMALRPGYVEILEQHWMRDSICTLTNAYPDHEDMQGPAGVDIPRCMVPFIPRGQHLLTAEENMLPIFREAAADRSTALATVSYRDHALLPADLLARFPYQEHPHNIALVVNLARLLGVKAEVALKEMADWVVPDLGVLKTYPEARWRNRRLRFSNGMSANERTGFLNNWQRLAFDRPAAPGEWVVTLVNNRADRVSRSEVFAEVLVNDAAAHVHLLIGTNLTGLRGYLDSALAARLARFKLFHPEERQLPPAQQRELALGRARRLLGQVRLEEIGPTRLAQEAQAMARGLGIAVNLPPEPFAQLLVAPAPSRLSERQAALATSLPRALPTLVTALGEQAAEVIPFLAREVARHAAVIAWERSIDAGKDRTRAAAESAFRALYTDLFRASVIPLPDPHLTGDQVIDQLATRCPPGYRVRILGAQNIKGTGLDFAYRWIAYDRTTALAEDLFRLRGEAALAAASELTRAEDAGILDGPVALEAVWTAANRETGAQRDALLALGEQIAVRQDTRERALAGGAAGKIGPITGAFAAFLDVYDGIRRRRRADRIIDELIRGHLSHERAARELRDLVNRQKGGKSGDRSGRGRSANPAG